MLAVPFFVPLALALIFQSTPTQQSMSVDEKLSVSANRWTIRQDSTRFEGEVTATYGVTKVRCDELLVVFQLDASGQTLFRRAVATGNVEITDPEGIVRAQRFEFDWQSGKGLALQAELSIVGITLQADSLRIEPEIWVLDNVVATTCERGETKLAVKRIELVPGQRLTFERAVLRLFGMSLGPWPKYSFSLAPGKEYTSTPRIGYDDEQGFRVRWKHVSQPTKKSVVEAQIGVFEERQPRYQIAATQSLLGETEIVRRPEAMRPSRPTGSFMHSIDVQNPTEQSERLGARRLSVSLGSSWNLGSFDEFSGDVDRTFEAVVEGGGAWGAWSGLAQTRFERLDLTGQGIEDRWILAASVAPDPIVLSEDLTGFGRIDYRGIRNDNGNWHSWSKVEVGLSLQATPNIRLSASTTAGKSNGIPRFEFDQPKALSALGVRLDADLGATRIGFLSRYKSGELGWHSTEIFVAQAADCFEPYILYRAQGHSLSIGITFRPYKKLQEAAVRLSNRNSANQPVTPP